MMAANGTQALREKVLFPPNQPVRLALKYAQPKIGKSPSGDDYALFTTTDNKVFFLDCDEARVITGAGIPPGQDIDVTMRWSGKRGDPKIYGVSLPSGTAAYGAQPNGTFAVPSTQHPAPSTQPETKLEWELRTSLELQDLKRKLALAEQEKRAAAAPREQPATAPVVHSQVNSVDAPRVNSGIPFTHWHVVSLAGPKDAPILPGNGATNRPERRPSESVAIPPIGITL
jgi:hypothetical protein